MNATMVDPAMATKDFQESEPEHTRTIRISAEAFEASKGLSVILGKRHSHLLSKIVMEGVERMRFEHFEKIKAYKPPKK